MTNAFAQNGELATDTGTTATSRRFEPIQKILARCDEKTVEYGRSISALAA